MGHIEWGPQGETVYRRTYSRVMADGTHEDWPDTVRRVVDGNLALVDARHRQPGEREDLIRMMEEFKILPGGRHLWASGVKNATHLFNCWVAGFTDNPADHFEFTFLRLMEGGGVGANYSNFRLPDYGPVRQELWVEVVCDDEHQDYQALRDEGVISDYYDPAWPGAFVIEDSREGWAAALRDLIETHYREDITHYRRVYDVSRIRPAGAKLRTFGGRASGPLPFARMLIKVCEVMSELAHDEEPLSGLDAMAIDHAVAQCVVAGGVRRSARMSMMHWGDPQISDFINCKAESGEHWTTNISVEVDEAFWNALGKDNSQGHQADAVLWHISNGMAHNGEPGFWDSSLSNVEEPNEVICTNPCGEITLQAWEPCNLGHVNLAAFVGEDGTPDYDGLHFAHILMTRFLIRATFAQVNDPKSREVLDRNRRIGVGHLGVASFLAMCGIRYSDGPACAFPILLQELAKRVDWTAEYYAHDLRIPVPVKKRTVAPTGTIAKMPGVSEGIHPIFSKFFIRRIRFNQHNPADMVELDKLRELGYDVEVDQYAPNTLVAVIPTKDTLLEQVGRRYDAPEEIVQSADELTLRELLGFQAMYQEHWADNAVSFTANIEQGMDPRVVAGDITRFAGELKGATVFPEASMPQAPYTRITKEEYEQATAHAVGEGINEDCANGACPVR